MNKIELNCRHFLIHGKLIPDFIRMLGGYLLLKFVRRKTFVVILCSMRSGSTLLKALLGEAKDVSHINEYNFEDYYYNKYIWYFRAFMTCRARIIVLKHPRGFGNYDYPRLPDIDIKAIVLIRTPQSNIQSLLNMPVDYEHRKISKTYLEEYWETTYKNIVAAKPGLKDFTLITYKDLTNNPVKETQRLFKFIGSSQTDGVDTYNQPDTGEWRWNIDDASENIKSKSVKPANADANDALPEQSSVYHQVIQTFKS